MWKIFEKRYGHNDFEEKTHRLELNLTKKQVDLLANSVSDLGKEDRDCLVVQKQVVAILNTKYMQDIVDKTSLSKINLILANKEILTIDNVTQTSISITEDWFSNADPEDVLVVITEKTGKRTKVKLKDVLVMEVE